MDSAPSSSSSGAGGASCTGTVANSWGTGFQVDAAFTNGPPSISTWKVELDFGQPALCWTVGTAIRRPNHRAILADALFHPEKKRLAEVPASNPEVGRDEDFERMDDNSRNDEVFG